MMKNREKKCILGAKIDAVSQADAAACIFNWAQQHCSKSVFFADAHMLTRVYDSLAYGKVINSADLVCPDGVPVAWLLRRLGVSGQEQVAGPDMMLDVCREAEKRKIPIGLLGSTSDLLDDLQRELSRMFPDLQIRFCHSPPFRAFTVEENRAIVESIIASESKIIFVALGCPKQEIWINAHAGKIPAVMLGVGWAFAVHAKRSRRAPTWVSKMCLESVHQILLHPEQYLVRYLKVIPKFCLLVGMSFIGLRQISDDKAKSDLNN